MLKLTNVIKHYMKLQHNKRFLVNIATTLSKLAYKGDHELSSYQPCVEGEARGVNNDDATTDHSLPRLTGLIV